MTIEDSLHPFFANDRTLLRQKDVGSDDINISFI